MRRNQNQSDESAPPANRWQFLLLSVSSGALLVPLVVVATGFSGLVGSAQREGWQAIGYALQYGFTAAELTLIVHFAVTTTALAVLKVRRYGLVSLAGNGVLYTILIILARLNNSTNLQLSLEVFVVIATVSAAVTYGLFRWLFSQRRFWVGIAATMGVVVVLLCSQPFLDSWARATSHEREKNSEAEAAAKIDFQVYIPALLPKDASLKGVRIDDKNVTRSDSFGLQLSYGKPGVRVSTSEMVVYQRSAKGTDSSRCSIYGFQASGECALVGTTKQGYKVFANASPNGSPHQSEMYFTIDKTAINVEFPYGRASHETLVRIAESFEAKPASEVQAVILSAKADTDSGLLAQHGLQAYVPRELPKNSKSTGGYVSSAQGSPYVAFEYSSKSSQSKNFTLYERKRDEDFDPPAKCASAHPELSLGTKDCQLVATTKGGTDVYRAEEANGKLFYLFLQGDMLITVRDEYGSTLSQDEVIALANSMQQKSGKDLVKAKIFKD